ncbi:MAG: hypothetical protein ACLS6O_01485 [Bifidobacterium sp.]
MITNAEGKVLVSKDGTNALSNETVEAAKSDPAAKWILNIPMVRPTSCSMPRLRRTRCG